VELFKRFIQKSKNNFVVTYINSSVEVKAISDVVCTSSSAEKIVSSIPSDKTIVFGTDKYLGSYIQKKTKRDMRIWPGTCIVHENFSKKHLVQLMTLNTDADVIAHPECPEELLNYANHIGSTSSLLRYVSASYKKSFIVLTEPGIIHQMKKARPDALFYSVDAISDQGSCKSCSQCPYMRLNTLEKLYKCLLNESPKIELEDDIRIKAKRSIDKMFEMLCVA
jgi:quinolinate synthase